METQLNKTITQKIALFWLKQVDSGLLLFKLLKTLSKPFRVAFYTGLTAFTIFGMKFISTFIPSYDNPLWQFLGDALFYGAALGISLVATIESVLNEDVATILSERKAALVEYKKKKLEKWRLRNMTLFLRIILYILLYMFLLFIIQISAQGAFINIFAAAPNTPEVQKQVALFVNEYDSFVKWFTFVFIISGLILDYFVTKTRALRKLEAQNETV